MSTYDFMVAAKKAVADFLCKHHHKPVEWVDVFVVWQCKVLQNQKLILAAPTPDQLLFEATYNGDKQQMYLDVYDKLENICIDMAE